MQTKKERKLKKYYYFLRILRLINILKIANSKFSVIEVGYAFNVARATINRDMKDLRSLGIPIHSTKHKGIEIKDESFNKENAFEYLYNKLNTVERSTWKQYTN